MSSHMQTISKTSTCIERTNLPRIPHHYHPRHTEILLVQLDIHQRITSIIGTLNGVFVDALTRREIGRYTKELNDAVLYAIESLRFRGYHYIVGYSYELGSFACSCYEAKQYSICQHDQEVQEYVNSEVMHGVA
jgi:hypothetical protein